MIALDKADSLGHPTGGVNVKNCGSMTHISAGSSAICRSSDSQNPVSFTTDETEKAAVGHYQVEQEK